MYSSPLLLCRWIKFGCTEKVFVFHFSLQVQQSVHNSFYNTTSFDPTYAALKGITSAKGADGVIYGALASQVYGSVADQVYQDIANHSSAVAAPVEEVEPQTAPDPTTLFEAARAKFFQEGQKVLFKHLLVNVLHECCRFHVLTDISSLKGSGRTASREKSSSFRERAGPQPNPRESSTPPPRPSSRFLRSDTTQTPRPAADTTWRTWRAPSCNQRSWRVRSCC